MQKHKERRDQNLPYISDAGVLAEQFRTKLLLRSFNRALPFNAPKECNWQGMGFTCHVMDGGDLREERRWHGMC